MVSSRPRSTCPGCVRQVNGVGVGVCVGGDGVKVNAGSGVKVGGIGIGVEKDGSDGEQAKSPTARSESSVIIWIA